MTLADDIRALLKARGPLTAPEIRALLPARRRMDGSTHYAKPREIHSRLHASCQKTKDGQTGTLGKLPGDRYEWLRDPVKLTPEERAEKERLTRQRYEKKRHAEKKAARAARGVAPTAKRALRIVREKDYSTRQENASKAQAISRRELGLRDMPDAGLPCTESWLAANGDRYEVLPSSGPRAVSPAARLRYTYG